MATITPNYNNAGTSQGSATTDSPTYAGLTLSGLTSTRVIFSTTGGLLTDSSTFTFNSGTGALSTTSLTATGLTVTRVPYVGTGGLLQDSANLTYAPTIGTGGLTIANTTASATTATGALILGGGLGAAGAGYFGGIVSGQSLALNAATANIANTNVTSPCTVNGINFYTASDIYMGVKTGSAFRLYNNATVTISTSDTGVALAHTTDATAVGAAALVLSGGLGVAKKTYHGDVIIPATGTTTIAPIQFTAGTNLTNAIAGGY